MVTAFLDPLLINILKVQRIRLESWFDKVIDIAKKGDKDSSVIDIMTDIFTDVTSVADAIVNYATKKK